MCIRELSAIRGLAALVVLLGHIFGSLSFNMQDCGGVLNTCLLHFPKSMSTLFNGAAAVEVFFVLSGLVLTLSFLKASKIGAQEILAFYIRRIFRIYPILVISIAFVLVFLPLLQQSCAGGECSSWASSIYNGKSFSTTQIFLSFLGIFAHMNDPMWSLRVELLYSLLFPIIFLAMQNDKTRLPALAFLFALAVSTVPRIYSVHYALAFALGSAIPHIKLISSKIPFRAIVGFSILLLILARPLTELLGIESLEQAKKASDVFEIIAAFLLIYPIFHKKINTSLLCSRTLLHLGNISYSFYLLHFPILFILLSIISKHAGTQTVQNNPALYTIVLGICTLTTTVLASSLTYYWIEKPFQDFGKKLATKFASRSNKLQYDETD